MLSDSRRVILVSRPPESDRPDSVSRAQAAALGPERSHRTKYSSHDAYPEFLNTPGKGAVPQSAKISARVHIGSWPGSTTS